jgi:hypothetical protein
MQKSYGVVWQEGDAPAMAGKLELGPQALRLEGRDLAQEISYDRVTGVHVGRSARERLNGRPSVVLERDGATPLTITTVAQSSLVGELAARLAELQLGVKRPRRLAVVVPLKSGSQSAVRALLTAGPPFDPGELEGLDRHQVFLTPTEVVFLFEYGLGADALEPLLATPELWQAAADWREHLAGPPRIAEDAYSWSRAEDGAGLSYLATPGPGDSDGGDIF